MHTMLADNLAVIAKSQDHAKHIYPGESQAESLTSSQPQGVRTAKQADTAVLLQLPCR